MTQPNNDSKKEPAATLSNLPIERAVADAESIERRASKLISRLEEGIEHNKSIAIGCEKQLKNSALYMLTTGTWEPKGTTEDQVARRCCRLFWGSIRIAVLDQFGGFAVPDADYGWIDFRDAALTEDGRPNRAFWSIVNGKDQTHVDSRSRPDTENIIGRIWMRIAHANVFQRLLATSGGFPEIRDLDQLFKKADGALSKLPQEKEVTNLQKWHGSDQPDRFNYLRRYATWRLINRWRPDRGISKSDNARDGAGRSKRSHDNRWDIERYKLGIPDDQGLIMRLRLLLSRGAESPTGVEVSLLLRTLAGRYLNDSPVHLEWAEDSPLEAVRSVLRRQNELNGSWDIPSGSSGLFLHRFSPLLHILDLDTDLLRLESPLLVEKCARALDSTRRALSVQEANLQEALEKNKSPNMVELANSVVQGLSLGATVSDRLKDLLSDSILRDRKADDGYTKLTLNDMPNSLNFRSNIKEGVIDKWVNRSLFRPGAILIYGPPGTGKTTVAKIIVSELNRTLAGKPLGSIGTDSWKFLSLSAADFAGEGSDGIVACAKRLFGDLRKVRRCVVLLDEMEEFLRARGYDPDRDSRLVTTAFLPLLQEAVSSREVILIVATNFVGSIDAAVTRHGRFDLILPLGPPDGDARKQIIAKLPGYARITKFLGEAKKQGRKKDSLNADGFLNGVADYSMGYSRTEIEGFFRELCDKVEDEVSGKAKSPIVLANEYTLKVELWRIRAEFVPIALSGRAGSDWRSFEDEANRYHRYAPRVKFPKDTQAYWSEPALPLR